MQKRRADQPRHEGGIFNRIPEPPPAPAGVDTSLDQSPHRERERNREPHIAEIEQLRMDGEAKVLQYRIEIASLERRRRNPQERIGSRQDEKIEGRRDPRLDRKHDRLE